MFTGICVLPQLNMTLLNNKFMKRTFKGAVMGCQYLFKKVQPLRLARELWSLTAPAMIAASSNFVFRGSRSTLTLQMLSRGKYALSSAGAGGYKSTFWVLGGFSDDRRSSE